MPLSGRWANRTMWVALAAAGWAVTSAGGAEPATPAPPAKAWKDTADLGLVITSGNTDNTNFSLANVLTFTKGPAELEFRARALRVKTTSRSVTPDFEDPQRPRLRIEETETTTTENFDLRLRFQQTVHKRLGWFTAASWEQNRPAGLASRTTLGGGLTYNFSVHPSQVLRVEAGLEGTREAPENGDRRSHTGGRLAARHERDITRSARLTAGLELLQNFQDTQDYRANAEVGLASAINNWLALKVAYSLKYDHQPQFQVFPNPGDGPGLRFDFDTMDTVFSTALVAKF